MYKEIGLDIYPGRTFLLPKPPKATPHLWIAVTEPDGNPEQVVIVNLTTLKEGSDTTLILNHEDHPFIKHETVVYYADARLAEVKLIQKSIQTGVSRFDQNCSDELLERIQSGLLKSPLTPKNIKKYCQTRF